LETEAPQATAFYYKAVSIFDGGVSEARQRIAEEVMQRAERHYFTFRCPRPILIWFRAGTPDDHDLKTEGAVFGQARHRARDDADMIRMYISADISTVECLVRTVAHEHRHVYRLANYRPPTSKADYERYERDAEQFEEVMWGWWVETHGDTIGEDANREALKWRQG
jgi:hypothetical protein